MRLLAISLALLAPLPSIVAAEPGEVADAVAWYDSLGYPDAKDLPYVRVATGAYHILGNNPPENQFLEGFLVGKDAEAFRVFICNVGDFKDWGGFWQSYDVLATVRFVPRTDGPEYKQVGYEELDLRKASSDALQRVRAEAAKKESMLTRGVPLSPRTRIFAFGRACAQKGLVETGSALMKAAAEIQGGWTSGEQPKTFLGRLQEDLGNAVLWETEPKFENPAVTWSELLKIYEDFGKHFPKHGRSSYAQEAADLLRKMVAEEEAHHPKPREEMSEQEQIAEEIYQLRNLGNVTWIMHNHYPLMVDTADGRDTKTSVHRLIDFGEAAMPQLIAALDDRRFTRSMQQSFNGAVPREVSRVGEIVQRILEHVSGRNFFPQKNDAGVLVNGTTRQQAEAWWAEVEKSGEKQVLIKTTRQGGDAGHPAAFKLVEKYPDAAIEPIVAGYHATKSDTTRYHYVEAAAKLPGDAAIPFLKSCLTPETGLYSQVHAAEALQARGDPAALQAMIQAWKNVQPRLRGNKDDAYHQAGEVIVFLVESNSPAGLEAMRQNLREAPLDIRLAAVRVFLPSGKTSSMFGEGPSVDVHTHRTIQFTGEAQSIVERLLVSELDDTARRMKMGGTLDEASYKDPRICDMAAFVLSKRWPDKYRFKWSPKAEECDSQFARVRERWHSDNPDLSQP